MSKRDSKLKFLKKNQSKPLFAFVDKFKFQEIIPIVNFLNDSKTESFIKLSLKKYLIISSVSLIERTLSRLASKIIDDEKIDVEKVLKNCKNFNTKYKRYHSNHHRKRKGNFMWHIVI